jgi:GT2 family glycosyltransferase
MTTVMIGFPHDGRVHTEFMIALFDALAEDEGLISDVTPHPYPDGALDEARNEISRVFLDSDCDWLWMLTTDMIMSPRTISALLTAAEEKSRPVIGALCVATSDGGELQATCYGVARSGFTVITDLPDNTLLPVAATGASCLLIHRTVFTRITDADPDADGQWWTRIPYGDTLLGEDLSFFTRARLAGIPVHVHTGIRVGRMAAVQLGVVDP